MIRGLAKGGFSLPLGPRALLSPLKTRGTGGGLQAPAGRGGSVPSPSLPPEDPRTGGCFQSLRDPSPWDRAARNVTAGRVR